MAKKPDLNVPTYDGKRFDWHDGHGTCCASDLGIAPGCVPYGRIWTDSCDVGVRIEGRNETKLFTLSAICGPDGDSEVTHWKFTAYPVDPHAQLSITIFND